MSQSFSSSAHGSTCCRCLSCMLRWAVYGRPSSVLSSISLLTVRLYLASVFWPAGMVKIASWSSTVALFADEYKMPWPELTAVLATVNELGMSALLVLGFFTPFAALALLGMTLVIELFVYPDTTEHYYWLLLCGVLLTHGGGKFAIDAWLRSFFDKRAC